MDDSSHEGLASADIEVDPEELFEALGSDGRRYVLACLDAASRPLHLADLATQLAHVESETDDVAERRRELSLHLYHTHLPKLADAGLVAFDRDERTATLTGDAEILASETDVLPDVADVTGSGDGDPDADSGADACG